MRGGEPMAPTRASGSNGPESTPTLETVGGDGLSRRRLLQGGLFASAVAWQTPALVTWRSPYALQASPLPVETTSPKPPQVGETSPPLPEAPASSPKPTETPLIGPAEITRAPRLAVAQRAEARIAVTGVEVASLAGVSGAALTAGTAAVSWANRVQRIYAHAIGAVEVPERARRRRWTTTGETDTPPAEVTNELAAPTGPGSPSYPPTEATEELCTDHSPPGTANEPVSTARRRRAAHARHTTRSNEPPPALADLPRRRRSRRRRAAHAPHRLRRAAKALGIEAAAIEASATG